MTEIQSILVQIEKLISEGQDAWADELYYSIDERVRMQLEGETDSEDYCS